MKKRLIGNLIYGQSGGPTSVINSSAYGLFAEAKKHKDRINKIYAMHYGIEGLLKEDIIDIDNYSDKELKNLLTTPGSAFGSNRYKLGNDVEDKDKFDKIIEIFKKYNIRFFFYNGGNDSMETIKKILDYAKKVNYDMCGIGIPKTIDNDLPYLDHTPGYGSAAKFIANVVSQIYFDDNSYINGRVNIIEIMGRNAGWLTASSSLATLNGAIIDMIYVPEAPFNIEEFLKKVEKIYQNKKRCLVCVSEGIKDKDGNFISAFSNDYDAFGHNQLGGVGMFLSSLVTKRLNLRSRYIELSLLQRTNTCFPSDVDVKEARKVASYALKVALRGSTNKIVTIKRVSDEPYKIKLGLLNIALVANKEKYLPLTYLNIEHDNILPSFIKYALPLIGNDSKKEENGLYKSFKL